MVHEFHFFKFVRQAHKRFWLGEALEGVVFWGTLTLQAKYNRAKKGSITLKVTLIFSYHLGYRK